MYNRGDLMLNDSVMKRLRQHFNPQKVLQLAGVVDVHDGELTRKIQEQLVNQYDLQLTHGSLLHDRGHDQNTAGASLLYGDHGTQHTGVDLIPHQTLQKASTHALLLANEDGPTTISHLHT